MKTQSGCGYAHQEYKIQQQKLKRKKMHTECRKNKVYLCKNSLEDKSNHILLLILANRNIVCVHLCAKEREKKKQNIRDVVIVVVRARRELYTLTERWNQIYECIWTTSRERERVNTKKTHSDNNNTETEQKCKNASTNLWWISFCTNDQIAAKVDGVFEQQIVWSSFFFPFSFFFRYFFLSVAFL